MKNIDGFTKIISEVKDAIILKDVSLISKNISILVSEYSSFLDMSIRKKLEGAAVLLESKLSNELNPENKQHRKNYQNLNPLLGFDPTGEVFTKDGRVYRGVFRGYGEQVREVYRICNEANLFNNGIVKTKIAENTPFEQMGYDLILEHDRVPFISYAHEWTPTMLKEAAQFQLTLNLKLLDSGLILKDCGVTTNVLFNGAQPVYVDFLSIIPVHKLQEEDWLAPNPAIGISYSGLSPDSLYFYEIFKRMFFPGNLFPLYLLHQKKDKTARKRLLETALNTSSDTISEQETFIEADKQIYSDYQHYQYLKTISLEKNDFQKFLLTQLRELDNLKVEASQSGYSDYYELKGENFDFTPSSSWKPKQWGVFNALKNFKPATVLDIGANTGWFSILSAKQGAKVVSIDNDVACMDILYRKAKQDGLSVLPLIVDFLKPTEDIAALPKLNRDPHIQNSRFGNDIPLILSADKRIACDMVIALAIIHHLCLGEGNHLATIINQLSLFAQKHLILEFVTKDDPLIVTEPEFFKAQHANPTNFDWYQIEACLSILSRFFQTIEQIPLTATRTLLVCTDKIIAKTTFSSPKIHTLNHNVTENVSLSDNSFLPEKRKRTKILYTTPVIEHPPAGGPALRVENSIKTLNIVSELHLFPRISQNKLGGQNAEDFYRKHSYSFTYTPYLTASTVDEDEVQNAREIVNYAARNGIKIIWCGYGNISYTLMKTIKELNPKLKVVCDTDSVWSRFVLRELALEKDYNRRQSIEIEGLNKQNEEADWVKVCDITTAVSEVDAEYYRNLADSPSRIFLFSNVIDLQTYSRKPAPATDMQSPSIYLAGSFYSETSPMVRAAQWVISDILPKVITAIPNVKLYCIGKGADKYLNNVCSSNIVVKGKVESVLPYLCHADVAIIPLKYESGTRFKILEAAACSIPMVSTSLGAEGLPVFHGNNILIADTDYDFANAIITLIKNKHIACDVAKSCNDLVRVNFGIERLKQEALDILTYLDYP